MVHLDKAREVSLHVVNKYIEELKRRNQLPKYISNYDEAAQYLSKLTTGKQYRFRYAPVEQYDLEAKWLAMEDLAPFESNRGRVTRVHDGQWQ